MAQGHPATRTSRNTKRARKARTIVVDTRPTRCRLAIAQQARRHGILTITELQHRTHVSYVTLHKLWNNNPGSNPQLSMLERIADAIGVGICDLIEEEAPSVIAQAQ